MRLKEFIKEALLSVVEGVEEAHSKHKRFKIIGIKRNEGGVDGNFIDFDISVTVEEKTSGQVGGKVGANLLHVVSAKINSDIDQSNSQQNVHRLKFRVWISENELSRKDH